MPAKFKPGDRVRFVDVLPLGQTHIPLGSEAYIEKCDDPDNEGPGPYQYSVIYANLSNIVAWYAESLFVLVEPGDYNKLAEVKAAYRKLKTRPDEPKMFYSEADTEFIRSWLSSLVGREIPKGDDKALQEANREHIYASMYLALTHGDKESEDSRKMAYALAREYVLNHPTPQEAV